MPRHRMVRFDYWLEEPIIACSHSARLLMIGLSNFADDNGVHIASFVLVKAEVFPADSFSIDDIKKWINELIYNGLIREYTIENKAYWLVTDWKRRQKIDRPTSKYPLPLNELKEIHAINRLDDYSSRTQRVIADNSTSPRREVDESSIFSDCNIRGEDIREHKKEDIVVSEADSHCFMNDVNQSNCPHEEIIQLYHEILPMCRPVRKWTDARRKLLKQRWVEDKKHQSLNWWRGYFEYVKKSKFLIGQVSGRDERPPFSANLEWLTRPTNFTNVIEGKYHQGVRHDK